MRRSYKYRLFGSKKSLDGLDHILHLCRKLYNASLEQRFSIYHQNKGTISCYDQMKQLPELKKEFLEYSEIDAQVLQNVVERLDRTYRNFYRRIQRKEKKYGFPRFKSRERYNSFTMKQTGWKVEDRELRLWNSGKFKMHLSRPIEGDIKTVTIKRSMEKFYVIFSCDNVPEKKLKSTSKKIGLDVGLVSFCADSKGKKTDNPLYLKQSEKLLRRRQRSLSRKKKGSQNRKDAKLLVAKIYDKITHQRDYFLHQIANYYIQNYGNIFVENLEVNKMLKTEYLAKNIHDSSWGKFFQLLSYKAEEAGRSVTKVNPQFTSQRCSKCGAINQDLKLHQRIWTCPICGTVHDRDINGAKNILWVGQTHRTITCARTQSVVRESVKTECQNFKAGVFKRKQEEIN